MGPDSKPISIGIVGLGLMGAGIAQAAATAGYDVKACDMEQGLVDRALNRVAKNLLKMAGKGLMQEAETEAIVARIETSTDLAVVQDCELVIEAVYEDREAKRTLFQRLDALCPEQTLLASNTSTIAITGLASGLKRVERVLGLHFFNPVPVMKLVEVVKTAATSKEVIDRAIAFVTSLDKKPIVVRDQAGFVVNYLLTPYLFDAIRSLSSGLGTVNDIDDAMRYGCGHPIGPLALADLIGLDTLAKAGDILFEEYRESRYASPPLLKRLVELGDFGSKTGRGFYDYRTAGAPLPRDLRGL
jgi:3-hydroxybutyryl-CoA dehydrogenase